MVRIPEASLGSSDKKIPRVGFGTAEFPFGESAEVITESIVHAMKVGYRHFDTASVYKSEKFLGDGISEALRLGYINSRDQLFITSKLWCRDAHHDLVVPALKKTLM
ncbi:hypothetical protein P3X46_007321 [Hevea brasiliensis]|uniref:NADP-dependent oxidoreductase domain-containing protein n=2 Tax=Hevea brasiliensis TaxID=3981 RepID=A0ABQ9MX09_HEVBR|nr:hypothetical protein P3X46_007321 [Hevea brasiliensis]